MPAMRTDVCIQHRSGFTLIEVLTSIGIILLLAALMMGGLNAAKRKARRVRARAEIDTLVTAWQSFYAEYSRLPQGIDDMDAVATDILSGHETGGNKQNPKAIPFMEFHEHSQGYRDPWGNLYRVALDSEPYDGSVNVTDHGTVQRSVVAWSLGSDPDDAVDDVCSWKEQ